MEKKKIYSIFVDDREYSKVYRRYDKELCYSLISQLKSTPALSKAYFSVRKVY